jgi:4-amino-4-deoxy-L-arabinose transferase-like glycosyltransferase
MKRGTKGVLCPQTNPPFAPPPVILSHFSTQDKLDPPRLLQGRLSSGIDVGTIAAVNSELSSRILLAAIVATYAVIGVLYAAYTPVWQVPDEPAHYNYVRALAEGRGLPVMEMGDYNQEYLNQLTSQGFPPELSVDSVTYEDHQPPLYYLLATPVYLAFNGALLPLRLLSVVFGVALLVVVYKAVQAIFPARPEVALAATAFIAFIPQHVAMTAGVNNDTLAELIVAGALWALVIYAGGRLNRPWPIGLLLAAALLTKGSIYIVAAVAVIAVIARWRREGRSWRWAAGQLAWMLVPALLLSAPWFVRNGLTYGWLDPTGQARHDQVVEGQMRPLEYVALEGWDGYWERAYTFTFQSFWGQFGWMGVVLPARIYQALALFSIILLAGFLWWLFDRRRPRLTPHQRLSLILLLASSILTALMFAWYNFKFLQHQGRYLFPALIPIETAAALGLDQLASVLPQKARYWIVGALCAGMALFAVYCLFKFVVPFLS